MAVIPLSNEGPWDTLNKMANQYKNDASNTEAGIRALKKGDLEGDYDEDDPGGDAFKKTAGVLKAQKESGMYTDTPAGGLAPLDAMAAAIKNNESDGSGGYNAVGPVVKNGDRAYGAYQVMGSNIPAWTKDALGQSMTPQEFLKNPAAQDAVFKKQMGANLDKYGNVADAASIWFTGRPFKQAQAAGANDGFTSVSQYVAKVNQFLGKGSAFAATRKDVAAGSGSPITVDPLGNTPDESGVFVDNSDGPNKGRKYMNHAVSVAELQKLKSPFAGTSVPGIDPNDVQPEPLLKSKDGKMGVRIYQGGVAGNTTAPPAVAVVASATPAPTTVKPVTPAAEDKFGTQDGSEEE